MKFEKNIFQRNFLIIAFIGFFVFVAAFIIRDEMSRNADIDRNVSYIEFNELADRGMVESVSITDGKRLTFRMIGDETVYYTDNPRKEGLKEDLLMKGISVNEDDYAGLISSFLPLALMGGFFYMYSRGRKSTAMAFNAKAVSEAHKGTLFTDIAGNDEAKDSVADIIDFMKNPTKYERFGAKMPRGICLYGSPGTGKTLMARAIAGEAGVPFFAVSGSDFVQMYVGVGASRIRELFKKAREAGKAVIFIDEIDALGKKRNSVNGNDEREQTLNALLTEMSGFDNKSGIVVIAATNRLDTLDEALLRPGRFDRQIEISLPDVNARQRILEYYLKDRPLAEDVNVAELAKTTVYFSGAMLECLVNEAAILAAKAESVFINHEHFDKAHSIILAGSEKQDRSFISEHDRNVTAYHEAGHALISKLLLPENTVSKITIIPSTKGAGGFCINIPKEKLFYTKQDLASQICVSFGGRCAEELIFGDDNITTGASNDIEKATSLLKDYVARFGMGSGLLNLNMFDEGNKGLYEQCLALSDSLYTKCKTLLTENRKILEIIAQELLTKETLYEYDLERLMTI